MMRHQRSNIFRLLLFIVLSFVPFFLLAQSNGLTGINWVVTAYKYEGVLHERDLLASTDTACVYTDALRFDKKRIYVTTTLKKTFKGKYKVKKDKFLYCKIFLDIKGYSFFPKIDNSCTSFKGLDPLTLQIMLEDVIVYKIEGTKLILYYQHNSQKEKKPVVEYMVLQNEADLRVSHNADNMSLPRQ